MRHGQGYTIFDRQTHGIEHELTLLVPTDEPVKLIQLRVRNTSGESRQLSATYFAEWVLGDCRDAGAMHLVTEVDPETDALLARNTFRLDFADSVAFVDVNRRPRTITTDRGEFLGRHGSPAAPAALHAVGLSGAQVPVSIPAPPSRPSLIWAPEKPLSSSSCSERRIPRRGTQHDSPLLAARLRGAGLARMIKRDGIESFLLFRSELRTLRSIWS